MKRVLVAAVSLAALHAAPASAFKICIDPGHGGADPGAVGCGLQEDDVNLNIGLKLKAELEAAGQTVVITRTTDTSVALGQRSSFANTEGADRFVSLHNNAATGDATGTETFCSSLNPATAGFDQATKIQREVVSAFGLRDRGVKNGGSGGENFSVIVNTSMPATLSELAFVDNCAVDAVILANDSRRQDGADAHASALAAHLGFELSGDPPPADDGELKGVVFEDVGVGTADMTHRIGSATVRVVGRNDVVTADATTASWSFTIPAGTYRIRAEANGYVAAERDCDGLDAGGVRFCSIGLFPVAAQGEGEGEGVVGEGEGEGDTAEGEGDTAEGEGDTAEGEGDGGGQLQIERVVIRNKPQVKGGCSSSGVDVGAFSVLSLGLLLLARRRRQALPFAAALAMMAASQASAVTTSTAPTLPQTASTKQLVNERVVLKGAISTSIPSPNGQQLLVSDDHYDNLTVLDVKSGTKTTLTLSKRAGFRPSWVDDGHVAYRNGAAPFDGQPLVSIDAHSGDFVGPWHPGKERGVSQHGEVVRLGVIVDEAGALKNTTVLSPSDDRCFGPQLNTARGTVVVFECLRTGLWLHQDGATTWLGHGSDPFVAHDGKTLVFVATEDEGHVITAADLVVVDLTQKKLVGQRITTDRIERAAAVSDVDAAGNIVVAFVVSKADAASDLVVATLK